MQFVVLFVLVEEVRIASHRESLGLYRAAIVWIWLVLGVVDIDEVASVLDMTMVPNGSASRSGG